MKKAIKYDIIPMFFDNISFFSLMNAKKPFFSKITTKSNSLPLSETKDEDIDDLFSSNSIGSVWVKWSHLTMSGASKEDDENIISFVNDLFIYAISKWASDIHIEPNGKKIQTRLRVDGEFILYKDVDLVKQNSLMARIKIMSYLRIDEQRLPQDGKINFNLFSGKSVDMRVSFMPNIYGEKCVVRILRKEDKPGNLKDLGVLPYNIVKIQKHLKNTYGMILAVWPTGSGKSTTLFSLLHEFDAKKNNISTLEDPVEYRIPGVNHTQINPAIWLNFAEGLRSLLRQDPDILMVWEIRDKETAQLAVEASITGHIVFSTLHTNSASHTLSRLVNLWIDPLLISSSLRIIISQRLMRRLCQKCRVSYTPDETIKKTLLSFVGKYIKDHENITLYKAKDWWCEHCNRSWYKGRVGIYEVLEMSEEIEHLLLEQASSTQIEIQAIWEGMVPIKVDALIKVVLGETSLEEVFGRLWNL